MDALASGCLGSMDVIMVWAWMHWPVDALVAWTLSWFGHGCTGQWMPWQHGCYHGLGMDALANGWDADLSDRESGANEGDGAYI